MTKMSKTMWAAAVLALLSSMAAAKLPEPSDEAKAKAAENAAKSAWAGKVAAYQLCKSQDKVAALYKKTHGVKEATPAASACVEPGPFVHGPAAAAPADAAAPAAPKAAAPVKKS